MKNNTTNAANAALQKATLKLVAAIRDFNAATDTLDLDEAGAAWGSGVRRIRAAKRIGTRAYHLGDYGHKVAYGLQLERAEAYTTEPVPTPRNNG